MEHGIDIADIIDNCKPPPSLTLFKDIVGVDFVGVEASEEAGDIASVGVGVEASVEAEAAKEQDVGNGPKADHLFDLQETDKEDENLYAEANTNAESSIGKERWFEVGDTEAVDGGSDIDSDATDSDALDSMSEKDADTDG